MCLEDTARVPLYARDGSVRAYAIVDAIDAEWAMKWRWHLSGARPDCQGYARRDITVNGQRKPVLLHREVLTLANGYPPKKGDHINRNTLDDRRVNLRAASHSENMQNRPSHHGSSSIYRNVYWSTDKRRWRVEIRVHGHKYRFGSFYDEHEAGRVAKQSRLLLMPYAVD